MGRPRSNTLTSTRLFSVRRFGRKAARATQVARASPRLRQRSGKALSSARDNHVTFALPNRTGHALVLDPGEHDRAFHDGTQANAA